MHVEYLHSFIPSVQFISLYLSLPEHVTVNCQKWPVATLWYIYSLFSTHCLLTLQGPSKSSPISCFIACPPFDPPPKMCHSWFSCSAKWTLAPQILGFAGKNTLSTIAVLATRLEGVVNEVLVQTVARDIFTHLVRLDSNFNGCEN